MAVDYLSAMNVGSGLNVTQIVDALVDAEKAPREAQLNENIEEKTVSISAFAEVKQEFNTLKTNLATLGQFSGLQVQTIGPSGISTAISATVTDPSLVKPFDHNIVVNAIAQPQTISFSGYSAENATLDASNLTIDLGSWAVDAGGVYSFSANANAASKSIALDNTDTLATVRDKINQLNIGVSASIIKISDTNYSLSLTSALGTKNQIRVQATSTSGAISNLSFDPATNGSGAANGGDAQKQVAAASDASLTFNGVSVSRSSNQISDLVSGVKIDVKAVSTTSEKITASYDQTLSLDAMKLFVDELNTVTKNLISLSKTSLKEEDTGPLAGDTLVRSYRNKLRLMTTTPISGYGVDDIYLSNFGVMTNLDGTLSIDKVKFRSYFATNPSDFAALANSRVSTNSLSVQAKMTGTSYTPGVYRFVKNSDSTATIYNYIKNNDGSVSLGTGTSMSLENGIYKTTTGGAVGVHITADGTTADSKVYIGKSLFDTLQDFTKSVLRVNSDIDQKVSRYSDDIKTYNEQLEDLNAKMETQRDLYVQRFTAMETAVASFKETGTLLDNFMEAWRAGLS